MNNKVFVSCVVATSGNTAKKKQLAKLKIYYGKKHLYSSQNPIEINFIL